ncbi:MAG: hypothetical protein IIB32_08475, partial [Chloroflexi bacterium]|nr:hypothetical protein [Chloroflexota bacterium]
MVTSGVSKSIGTSVRRKRDRRLITGGARYTGDVQPNDALFMAVLRSPHAHARILNLDVSPGRAAPGVAAVFTGKDLSAKCRKEFPLS